LENKFKKILIIGAHPDDETLGLGGTINRLSKNNANINCIIFADGESARGKSEKIEQRKNQSISASKILGIKKMEFLSYQDQTLDIIPVVELAKKIEFHIKKNNPDTIFTHFWGDVNQDHRRLFEATNIAVRSTPNSKVKNIICYETPSSTEWGLEAFKPNLFVDISKEIKIKLKALKKYSNEIEKYPHPRSELSIKGRANYWGSTSGKKQAEAFIVYRMII
jgi:LmbE family N-acetylglucosaminyl deacetylase